MAQFNALAKEYANEQDMLNYRGAVICSVIAEVNRDRKKRKKSFTPNDFMPQKKVELSEDQILDQMIGLNLALGGDTDEGI